MFETSALCGQLLLLITFASETGKEVERSTAVSFDSKGNHAIIDNVTDLEPTYESAVKAKTNTAGPANAYSGKVGLDVKMLNEESIDVSIVVHSGVEIPYVPPPDPSNADFVELQVARQRILDDFRSAREREVSSIIKDIEFFGGYFLAHYYIGNVVMMRVPGWLVPALAEVNAIEYIGTRAAHITAPEHASGLPNNTTADNVAAARLFINTDAYYSSYGGTGYIGLLDKGVMKTHKALFYGNNDPRNRIREWRDCYCGRTDPSNGEYCRNIYDPECEWKPDDMQGGNLGGHGTKSATVMSANDRLTDDYRGVTSAKIDSWGCRASIGDEELKDCRLNALQGAVYYGDSVIVAEMQFDTTQSYCAYYGEVSAAFDDAYELGHIIVAANGNEGYINNNCSTWPRLGSVNCPANAHKVLGIGFYHIKTPYEADTCVPGNCLYNNDTPPSTGDRKSQSYGPTTDWRYKPDVVFPTLTETGSNTIKCPQEPCCAPDECVRTFCQTSGATPYAGAAALLLNNFYNANGMLPSPGKIYAALIGFGDRVAIDNYWGAGRVKLGGIGNTTWITGYKWVNDGQNQDFMFPISSGYSCDLKGAIWWPESYASSGGGIVDHHNDVDLYIYDSSGVERIHSDLGGSVFEKVSINGNLAPSGQWKYRIKGYDVPYGPQKVYYFLYYKTNGCQ